MVTTFEVVSPLLRSGQAPFIELPLTLETPAERILVHTAGLQPGRADAILAAGQGAGQGADDGKPRIWSAKHHWTETRAGDAVTIYEFDEALPAGQVLLRIPV
jgi:hypothetical protein